MQVLKWSSWDFLSPFILQKIEEDNIIQSGDYDANSNTRMGLLYISLFKFKSFDQFNTASPPPPPPPKQKKLPQILDIYSVVAV